MFFKTVVINIFLFFYIYNPMIKFLPFDSGVVVSIIVLVFYFFSGAPNLKRILLNKYVFIFYTIGLIVFFYTLVLTFFSGFDHLSFRYPIMYFRFFFELPLVTIALISLVAQFGCNTFEELIKILINIAIFQSIIVAIMLLSPTIRDFVFFNVLEFREGHDKIISIGDFSLRGFGLANGYLFGFPLFQGFAAVMILLYQKSDWFKYLFAFPLVLISALVNARVGVTPVLIYVLLISFFYITSLKKSKVKIILKSFSFMLVSALLIVQIGNQIVFNNTFSWIINGFINVFGGDNVGDSSSYNIIDKLLGEHLFFPNKLQEIFFGSGLIVFSNPFSFIKSDIGYVQYLFYGGIFFIILILTSFNYLLVGCLNYLNKNNLKTKIFILTIVLTILIVHFKGNVFNYGSVMKLSFLIAFYIISSSNKLIPSNFNHFNSK